MTTLSDVAIKIQPKRNAVTTSCASWETYSNNSEEEIRALAITEHTHSLNNEDNSNDSIIPCLSGNLTTSQIHIENNTKKKEPKILQLKALVPTNSHRNISFNF